MWNTVLANLILSINKQFNGHCSLLIMSPFINRTDSIASNAAFHLMQMEQIPVMTRDPLLTDKADYYFIGQMGITIYDM